LVEYVFARWYDPANLPLPDAKTKNFTAQAADSRPYILELKPTEKPEYIE
jgi:hypothetical protein